MKKRIIIALFLSVMIFSSSCIGFAADNGGKTAAGVKADNSGNPGSVIETKKKSTTEPEWNGYTEGEDAGDPGTDANTDVIETEEEYTAEREESRNTEEQRTESTENEKAGEPEWALGRFEILSRAKDVDLQFKEVCRVYTGEGENHVKCLKTPDTDYCPSNITFCENGDIMVVDNLGCKIERYTSEGEHVSSTDLRISDRPDSRLTYAVYSKGDIYAVYDQEYLYRIGPDGEAVKLASENILKLDVSLVDGRVVTFGFGSTMHVTDDGKLEEETEFKNIGIEKNPNNFRRLIEITYNRDGIRGAYKVDSPIGVDCIGVVHDYLILHERKYDRKIFIAYDHDGTVKFELARKGLDGSMVPTKQAYARGDKLYLLMCGAEYTAVYEITVTNK